jgi:nicotinamide riboside transporter PnuC
MSTVSGSDSAAAAEAAIGLGGETASAGTESGQSAWYRLPPVAKRWPWITSGLVLQLAGIAAPAAFVISEAHHEDVTGKISKATLTLAWRQSVHSHTGLVLMAVGAALFVVGSVLLARPYVKNWLMLFVAVPVAALAGVLVLGAAALVIAVIVAIAAGGDFVDFGGGGSGGARKKKRQVGAGAGQ